MFVITSAFAGPSLGAFVGVHSASANHELYDSRTAMHARLGLTPILGLRAGWQFGPFGLEGEGLVGPTTRQSGLLGSLRAHAIVSPFSGRWRPHVLAGAGSALANTNTSGRDIDVLAHLGLGVATTLTREFELRADARWLLGAALGTEGTVAHHGELLVGVTWRPGSGTSDSDGDGIPDSVDKCRNNAELPNGYMDEDGCPDELGRIRLKVKDAEGNLLRNVEVFADGQSVGRSNRDGRLDFGNYQPGTTVVLNADTDTLEPATQSLDVQTGENREDLILGWAPGTLLVTAKSLGGTPIAAKVWATGNGSENWTLDQQGTSERILAPGSWRVMLASDGYDAIIKLAEIEDRVGPRTRIDAILRPQRIQLRNDQIVTLDPVLFQKGSSTVEAESLGILEAVAAVLVNHAEIAQVEIGGHASAEGGTDANQLLSQQRVDRVRTMLIQRGVAPERLVAVGYGETQPKASNETADGRRRNRRVEFKVLATKDPK